MAVTLVVGGLALLATVALVLNLRLPEPAAPRHPVPRSASSIVVVTVDTTRPDRLEPYGATDVATPTLARLAAEGVTFERAYATAPLTLVAHTTLFTGLYPPQHGVRNNGLHQVPAEVETLAERLTEEGWRSGAFVSASVLERRYHLDQGFEVYDDDLSAGRERHPRMVADRPAEATVSGALAWLDGLGDHEPFFLWVHLYDPHAAYSPRPPYRDLYAHRLYDGEIAYMDAEIGRLLAHPRIDAETVVTVVGDHGESLGDHGEQTHGLLAYDSTLHVPWILKVPGGPAGLRVKGVVGQADLFPTVLDLLGLEAAGGVSGRSVVPLMEGRLREFESPVYAESYLPFYTYGWAKLRVLRRGQFKWIDGPDPELYDIKRDPRELTNLAQQEPGMAHDLSRDLAALWSHEEEEREAELSLDMDARERLRSLGYVATGSGQQESEGRRKNPKDMIGLHVGLERARVLMGDRLFSLAEGELRRVLDEDPTNLAAMIDLARLLAEEGDLEAAVRVADQALGLDPDYPPLYLLRADLDVRRGEPEKALSLVDAALDRDPGFLEAVLQKAIYLDGLGRRGEASTVLQAALAQFGEVPRLNAVYARVVEIPSGALAAAEDRLNRALRRDPFLILGWRLLGEVLEATARSSEAMEAYAQGLARQPDDADLHARLGLILARRGAGNETEGHLSEALRLTDGPRPELRIALGGWLAERGRLEEAMAQYEEVLAAEPQNAPARNNRAVASYRLGRLDEAAAELESLVVEYPRYADAHNNLAAIALDRGTFFKAAHHARQAVDINPALTEAWNNLGFALAEQSQTAEALKAYERALELDPAYWQARFNLALLRKDLRDWSGAVELFTQVLAQLPQLAQAHVELGDLYFGPLTRPAQARIHYNAFLRHTGEHPRRDEITKRVLNLPAPGPGAPSPDP